MFKKKNDFIDGNDGGKESKEERRKRRKSRWGGSEHEKTFIPGMPTVLPTNLTPDQEKAYLCKLMSLLFFIFKKFISVIFHHLYMTIFYYYC